MTGEAVPAEAVPAEAVPADAASGAVGTGDPWAAMRLATQARIGLGRSGHAMPTSALLQFQAAHALARDAVNAALQVSTIENQLQQLSSLVGAGIMVESAAENRAVYLQRPDLGRSLSAQSRSQLVRGDYDVVFVLADGLSAQAVEYHAVTLMRATIELLPGWKIAPPVIATQARVALGDEVGELIGAEVVVVLIGERPGLSSSDSLGVYLTYGPRRGRLDSERNCISNVRPPMGQSIADAAATLAQLMRSAKARGLTGTELKDDFVPLAAGVPAPELDS